MLVHQRVDETFCGKFHIGIESLLMLSDQSDETNPKALNGIQQQLWLYSRT